MLDEFPEVKPLLKGHRIGIHQEMTVFRQYTQDAIERRDRKLVCRAFQFIAACTEQADEYVRAAIGSSYCEELDLSGAQRRWVLTEMPSALRQVWFDINVFLEDRLGYSQVDRGFDREREEQLAARRRSG